ncbi:MAG: Bax inhibitor-1/YccA family protein [Flavobacteriales bacterium]|nr:Bax inhibitor-1/YccA family protein [Flavobacteriales bacterium]
MEEKTILDSKDLQQSAEMARTFTAHVFSWMVAALAVSAVTAYYVANSSFLGYLYNFETGGRSMLGWAVMLSPFAFILVMNFGLEKLSSTVISGLFLLFAICMGASLSYIFIVYSSTALITTFGITSGTFAVMALVGYTTKTDLTKFGSIMMMGLVGIIIAMIANWFMNSAMLDYIISIIGVLIFTGLIAYDTQKIKRIGMQVGLGSQMGRKLAIMGAMSLYLDFINLFLFLLRLLGSRD